MWVLLPALPTLLYLLVIEYSTSSRITVIEYDRARSQSITVIEDQPRWGIDASGHCALRNRIFFRLPFAADRHRRNLWQRACRIQLHGTGEFQYKVACILAEGTQFSVPKEPLRSL